MREYYNRPTCIYTHAKFGEYSGEYEVVHTIIKYILQWKLEFILGSPTVRIEMALFRTESSDRITPPFDLFIIKAIWNVFSRILRMSVFQTFIHSGNHEGRILQQFVHPNIWKACYSNSPKFGLNPSKSKQKKTNFLVYLSCRFWIIKVHMFQEEPHIPMYSTYRHRDSYRPYLLAAQQSWRVHQTFKTTPCFASSRCGETWRSRLFMQQTRRQKQES